MNDIQTYNDPNDIPEELLTPIESIDSYDDPNDIPNYLLEPLQSESSDYKDKGWDEVFTESIQNVPESGKGYFKSIYTAITHPKQTLKGLTGIAKGMTKMGLARIMADGLGIDPDKLDYSKDSEVALAKHLEDRYFTEEGLKEYVAKDPVGVWADAISVMIPLTKGTTVGKYVSTLEPTTGALKTGGLVFKLVKDKVPIQMYQNAVNFSTKLPLDEMDKVTRTALDIENQIMPNKKGLIKLKKSIDTINTEISRKIDASTLSGSKIFTSKLWNGIRSFKEDLLTLTDEPLKAEAAWKSMKKQIKKAIEVNKKRTPEEIQIIKQEIYKELDRFYGDVAKSPAKIKLRKAVAQNARQLIEDLIPEVKNLNQKEGALIELWAALENRAKSLTTKDIITFRESLKFGAASSMGYLVAGEKGAAVGAGMGILMAAYSHPQVKAKLAIVLEELRQQGITVNPKITGALLFEHEVGKNILQENEEE
jgi:hypothetical protein